MNLFPPLRTLKNRRYLSMAFETNRLNAAKQPVRLCTFSSFLRNLMSNKALIFSKLASMCHWLTMNFLEATTKTHLNGFSLILCLSKILKAASRCSTWFTDLRLFTTIPSLNFHYLANEVDKHFVNKLSISRHGLFQAKGHDLVTIKSPIYDEWGAFLVRWMHGALVSIHKTE